MAKDPAFLFYPNDWIGGTMHLDFECKGAYMELLMLQFNRGHMTSHMIGQVLGHRKDIIWSQIHDKFVTDGTYFWNQRLKEEKEKRISYSESRRNNLKGKNQYSDSKGHIRGHMTSHMENENVNVNEDINDNKSESKKFKKPELSEAQDYFRELGHVSEAQSFVDFYESNGWRVGRNPMKDWRAASRNWIKNKDKYGKQKIRPLAAQYKEQAGQGGRTNSGPSEFIREMLNADIERAERL